MLESTTVALILLMAPDGTPTPEWPESARVMPLVAPSLGVTDMEQWKYGGTLWQDYLNQARRQVREIERLPSLDALARMPDAEVCQARCETAYSQQIFCDHTLFVPQSMYVPDEKRIRRETPWPEERWKWLFLRDYYRQSAVIYAHMDAAKRPSAATLRRFPDAVNDMSVRQRREYLAWIKKQVGDEAFFHGDWPDWLPIWEAKH